MENNTSDLAWSVLWPRTPGTYWAYGRFAGGQKKETWLVCCGATSVKGEYIYISGGLILYESENPGLRWAKATVPVPPDEKA